MKDCQDLYLKWDVLLLVDVFEKFKSKFIRNYSLCPSHYLSPLVLSCNVILSMTKVKLDLILNIDISLFLEKGLRVGVSYISKIYSKASKNT